MLVITKTHFATLAQMQTLKSALVGNMLHKVNILLMKTRSKLTLAHTFSNCDTSTDIEPAFLLH